MTHKTNGIVLRTVKFGETSVIVTICTELFGVQSYIVNGVRISTPKRQAKANSFQPAAILDLVVYHNDLKNLQRIKEFKWAYLYQHVFFSVLKNSVALFMVELLQKCLKQPEPNPDMYHFIENAFIHLDQSEESVVANFPLFFAIHLAGFFGFRINDDFSERTSVLDLREGLFVHAPPAHAYFLEGPYSHATSQLLKVRQPQELSQIKLNQDMRRVLLQAYQIFYSLQIPEFGLMKSLPVLETILTVS